MGRSRRTARRTSRRTSRRMAARTAPAQAAPPAAAPAPAPTEAPQTKSYVQELEELAALKAKGILSEEEFQAKKKQILNL
ncbi:SHOCT domain-containing protein [Thermoproteota archaeon]